MAAETPALPTITGLTPYINVEGANAASAFYQRAFGAVELVRMPTQDGARLMHCCLQINGGHLMLSDTFPEYGRTWEPSGSHTLHLQVDDIDAWWARAVEAGARVVSPIALMFWGDRYGVLRDPFGVNWSLGMTPKA